MTAGTKRLGWCVLALFLCATATDAYGQGRKKPRRPGRILFKVNRDADLGSLLKGAIALTRAQGRIVATMHGARIEQANVKLNGRTEEAVAIDLILSGAVDFAEPDYQQAPSIIPNDPSYGSQWHHPKINSPAAWDSFTGDGSVTVAVCDTGIQSDHPDLVANLQLPGFNTVDNSTDTEPLHYHGTFVAGCIGAVGNNSVGVTGVAWNVKIVPLKISNRADGLAYLSDMAEAIQWAADNGAKIINVSYSGASSATIDAAAQYARGLDSLMFMSAGNDNSDISAWPDYTSFVLVGATDSSDARSSFSNYGTPVDITGPGTLIYNTTMGSSYKYSSGTSFSSPIAAGVGAMMRMAKPSLTASDVETRLYSACVDLGAAGEDSVFGHGRVDLLAALQAALGNLPAVAWDAVEVTDEATAINSALVATDGDNDPLTYSIVANGASGTAVITNAATGAYTYTPNGGTNGTIDSFTFKANDGSVDSNVATVTVAILAASSISPAPGSTFASDSQTFYWSPVAGATAYMIWAGSQAGTADYFSSSSSPDQYVDVTGLPTDGSTVYVRHLYWVTNVWNFTDYTYTALDPAAQMTSPADDATLGGVSQLFQWSAGIGNTQYWLEAGTAAAPVAYFSGDMSADLTYTITSLPTDGSAVQVRLWSYDGSAWTFRVTNYTAASIVHTPGTMTSPADGATLAGASETFTWDPGAGNVQFWLEAGTAALPVAYYSADMGVNTSQAVSTLPTDGSAVQVRLWSYDASAWTFNTYNYTADNGGGGGGPATMTSPADGATLAGASETLTWDPGSGNSQFWLEVGTAAAPVAYFSGDMGVNTSKVVGGLPTDGSAVQLRLWSYDGSAWTFNTYNYTAASGGGGGPATMTSPADGATLSGASETFTWDPGSGNTQFWLEVGTAAQPVTYFSGDMGVNTSKAVGGLPTNGSAVQVRLWSYDNSAWTFNTYNYTAASGGGSSPGTMTSPANGATLAGASETFNWDPGSGNSQFWLEVGTAAAPVAYYSGDMGASTSQAVSGLPTNGSAVQVRLWSYDGSAWVFNTYNYTAFSGGGSSPASMTSPANGATLAGASQAFVWDAGSGNSQFWLEVGTAAAPVKYYTGDMALSTSKTVPGLPTDGSGVQVRLWSYNGSAWTFNTYNYTAAP